MQELRRQQYLQLMGVQLWQARDHSALNQNKSVCVVNRSASTHDNLVNDIVIADAASHDNSVNNFILNEATVHGNAMNDVIINDTDEQGKPANIVLTPDSAKYINTVDNSLTSNVTDKELDWATLKQIVAACTACGLCKTRKQTVFGVGNHQAKLLIIGEAPGAQEDLQGEPFVGRAGQLLDAMLRSIGLNRQQIYIANILKCRPPNNRDPEPSEVANCTPFLQQQIALLQPSLILAVGRIAAHYLLNTNTPLSRMRGQEYCYGANGTPLLVTFHPAYLLRSPREKSKAYEDLLRVREKIYRL